MVSCFFIEVREFGVRGGWIGGNKLTKFLKLRKFSGYLNLDLWDLLDFQDVIGRWDQGDIVICLIMVQKLSEP
jgi:hypothetical protein